MSVIRESCFIKKWSNMPNGVHEHEETLDDGTIVKITVSVTPKAAN